MELRGLFLVVLLAIVVEALVEYTKAVIRLFTKKDYKTAITQLGAVVCSVLLCLSANADLFSMVGMVFSYRWVGAVLTGIFASRGANYVSDLATKLHTAVSR